MNPNHTFGNRLAIAKTKALRNVMQIRKSMT
jgi:hypothetical protein